MLWWRLKIGELIGCYEWETTARLSNSQWISFIITGKPVLLNEENKIWKLHCCADKMVQNVIYFLPWYYSWWTKSIDSKWWVNDDCGFHWIKTKLFVLYIKFTVYCACLDYLWLLFRAQTWKVLDARKSLYKPIFSFLNSIASKCHM